MLLSEAGATVTVVARAPEVKFGGKPGARLLWDRLRGLEAGANHYLTKSSFHDHTFLQAVTDLIGDA